MESLPLAAITTWLAAPGSFVQGAALYAACGPSATYKRLFDMGETAYSRPVLERELRALVRDMHEAIDQVQSEQLPEPPSVHVVDPLAKRVEETAEPVPTDSSVLVDVRRQLKAVRDERSTSHAQLTAPNLGKKARYDLARRIVALTDQEVALKAAEAHVLAHGRLPGPVATADVTDVRELVRRLANLRSQRSRLRKRPERADDLAALEAEIALIQTKFIITPQL